MKIFPCLPNALTGFRILCALYLFYIIVGKRPITSYDFAIAIFGCVTDFFDGWLARRFNWTSRFGEIMDPLADKMMCWSIISIILYHNGVVWEFVVPALITFTYDLVSPAAKYWWGVKTTSIAKWKTATLMVSTGMLLFVVVCESSDMYWAKEVFPLPTMKQIGVLSFWIAGILTITSAMQYAKNITRTQKHT